MREKITEYLRLFRIQYIGILGTIPVIGALSTGIQDIESILCIFIIGFFQYTYLFVSNDVIDIKLDQQSQQVKIRPLAKGAISKKTGILISVLCVIIVYILSFLFFYKNHITFTYALICLTSACILGTINNVYGKKFASSAIIAGIAQGLIIPYAAFLVSNNIDLSYLTIVISLLVFNQILFTTGVSGPLKDSDHDYKQKVRNYATITGVRVDEKDNSLFIPNGFKILGMGIRFSSMLLVFLTIFYFKFDYEFWQVFLILFFSMVVLLTTIKMFDFKNYNRDQLRKNIIVQIIFRSTLIQLLLFPVFGTINTLALVLFTFSCYIISIETMKLLNCSRKYYG